MPRKPISVLSAITAGEITADTDLTMPKRAAQILAKAAASFPYQAIPWRYLYKAATQQKAVPMEKSLDVIQFKKRAQAIREILEREHQRGFIPEGDGVRASVDSDDFMQKIVTPSTRRMLTTQARLQQRLQIVEPSTLRIPENVALFKTISRGMKELNGLNLPKRFVLGPKPPVQPNSDAE